MIMSIGGMVVEQIMEIMVIITLSKNNNDIKR